MASLPQHLSYFWSHWATPAPGAPQTKGKPCVVGAGVLILGVLALVAIGASCLGTITPRHGIPNGPSIRAGRFIATLIATQQPFTPQIDGRGGKERFDLDLFLQPDDGTQGKRVPLAQGLRAPELALQRVMSVDGDRLWIRAGDYHAYHLTTGSVTREASGPGLSLGSGEAVLTPAVAIAPNEWICLLSTEEAERDLAIGKPMPSIDGAQGARGIYVVRTDDQRRVVSCARQGTDEYRKAALLSLGSPAGPGVLSLSSGRWGLTRLDRAGQPGTRIELGIGNLRQVLPHPSRPAFIGERPMIPDRVSEPICVVVDLATGAVHTTTLWQ